jgi:hypothetical protein
VFNYSHQVVGVFWRDLCDDFLGDDFVLEAGMLRDPREIVAWLLNECCAIVIAENPAALFIFTKPHIPHNSMCPN